MDAPDVIVIGGGFAGLSTAWWLKRLGAGKVLVLEQEPTPGAHASGKNAGIARQAMEHAPLCALAARSVAFLDSPPDGFAGSTLLTRTGGYLLSTVEEDPRLEHLRQSALTAGVFIYPAGRADVLAALPVLDESPFRSAYHCPADGLVDIHALLLAYARGADLRTAAPVTAVDVAKGRVVAVEAGGERYPCGAVVNAAGAWAGSVGRLAGTPGFPLEPRRRHLLHTGALPWVNPAGPYAWFLEPQVYFRPESGGLLLSPCDELSVPPGSPPADPEAPAWLAQRLEEAAPRLANLPIASKWAELRCFAPDGLFVLGPDPEVANFHWACALGGHGMTTSAAVGELVASLVLGVETFADPAPFSPGRFSR